MSPESHSPHDDPTAAAEQRYRSVVAALREGVLVHDQDGNVIACNDSAVRILGLDRPGQPFVAVLEDGSPITAENSPTMGTLRTGLPARDVVARVPRADGDTWILLNNEALTHPGELTPHGVVTSITDITAHKQAERELTYLAYHDALTGLPNRTLLEEHLKRALTRCRRNGTSLALLHLDLDGFKLVNDSLGHHAGDQLLCRLAVRLQEATRATDVLARLGGDELALLIADVEDDALGVAERVAAAVVQILQEPFALDGVEFQIGASVGIALAPEHAADADTLLRGAESALYRAKAESRGGWAIFVPGRRDPRERLSMTARLRRALAADEFQLYYQPIFDLSDGGRITGVEALLRWFHPERGMIPPGEFIPLAEETGLIERLGDWVVRAACEQQVAWAAEGLRPQISFNVSPRQLRRLDFTSRIAHHLAETGADPRLLTVELTESSTLRDPEAAERILAELDGLGLKLAIDDFGAGYSSLSRLRHMPVGTLKIDRSFLRDVPCDREATTIVVAILRLAQALGREVVAEGVETEQQRAFLVGEGCRLAQGFLLGRPMPAADVAVRMHRDAIIA